MSNALVPSTGGGGRGGGGQHGGGGQRNSVGTAISGHARPSTGRTRAGPVQVLLCNRCVKPLATTCYLCKCDCIFCEECTFAHFSESSNCPKCNRTLGENDFTELVVADAAGSMTDIAKTSLQALFSNQSPAGNLPHAELCRGLLRQFDVARQSTKFLLKQLIMDSSLQGQSRAAMMQKTQHYQEQLRKVKQAANSMKLKFDAQHTDLSQRLASKEAQVATLTSDMREKDRLIEQFQQQMGSRVPGGGQGGGGGVSGGSGGPRMSMPNQVPPSSSMGRIGADRASMGSRMGTAARGGPINGFIQQQNQQQKQREQAMLQRRSLPLASSQGNNSMRPPPMAMGGGGNHQMRHSMGGAMQPHHPQGGGIHRQPLQQRPFSNNSMGSSGAPGAPPTPGGRIRNFTNMSYQFTSSVDQQGRANKRRRGHSAGSGGFSAAMSPHTMGLMNQGPHTQRR